MTGGLKMGVNVAAHTRHIFLGSAPGSSTPSQTTIRVPPRLLLSLVCDEITPRLPLGCSSSLAQSPMTFQVCFIT